MKKLALIGTGIAGLSAAYFLKDDYNLTIYEKNDYIGGHTNTINVDDGEKKYPMDTGFMVFNEKTYPNLLKLFKKLEVPYKNTDMSFSVRNNEIDLEFNGSSMGGLFAQKKNIFNLKFLRMIREILKFNAEAPQFLKNEKRYNEVNLGDYLKTLKLSDYFFKNFLAPMSSAVWSTPMHKIKDFPVKSLVRFFFNHGFVGVNTQLQWKTVVGGSREYRDRLMASFKDKISIHSKIKSIFQLDDKVEITTDFHTKKYDKVIVGTHADEALAMLKTPTQFQKEVLSQFEYQKNLALVHTDPKVMPKLKKNWSSWNFIIKDEKNYTVYYMNRLQNISEKENFFININGEEFINPNKIIKKIKYHHPVFNIESMKAQKKLNTLNSNTNLHFTGSYYRYGFHEDALLSSVNLSESILGRKVL